CWAGWGTGWPGDPGVGVEQVVHVDLESGDVLVVDVLVDVRVRTDLAVGPGRGLPEVRARPGRRAPVDDPEAAVHPGALLAEDPRGSLDVLDDGVQLVRGDIEVDGEVDGGACQAQRGDLLLRVGGVLLPGALAVQGTFGGGLEDDADAQARGLKRGQLHGA